MGSAPSKSETESHTASIIDEKRSMDFAQRSSTGTKKPDVEIDSALSPDNISKWTTALDDVRFPLSVIDTLKLIGKGCHTRTLQVGPLASRPGDYPRLEDGNPA